MKKLILLILIAVLIAAFTPGLVLAAGYDEPKSGESPHAGWTSTSDQCKQCHAVHKAIGNRNLLRSSDSRYNDCAYCHLDGAGAAGYDVYTNNLYNGHTMGSIGSGASWQTLAKTSVGAASQIIKARYSRFDSSGRVMIPDHGNTSGNAQARTSAKEYRGGSFAKSGSKAWVGYNTSQTVSAAVGWGGGLRTNGDTTFNCNACHQAHANPSKIITWRFKSLNSNARTRNEVGLFTYYGPDWASYTPIGGSSTATSDLRTVNTTSLTNKILLRLPVDTSKTPAADLPYVYDESTARNTGQRRKALTAWCAGCHNLNIMGPGQTGGGAAYYATPLAWDGDGKQYSWYSHNTAFSPYSNQKNSANNYEGSYAGIAGAIAPACYDCHVGYGGRDVNKDNPLRVASPNSDLKSLGSPAAMQSPYTTGANGVGYYDDWPHTGSTNSYALLKTIPNRMTPGDATGGNDGMITNSGTDASTYDAAGLDNVCRQCHANGGRDPKAVTFDNTEAGVFDNTVPAPGP